VASLIWRAFGDPVNFVEPFAGSLAVLLARPTAPRVETVNDLDGYLTNFWRAVQAAPDEVSRWADWPVSELDLHARHRWLVGREDFRRRMRWDPEFYDAKIAGWWVWGISQWIGSGWCAAPNWTAGAAMVHGSRAEGASTRPNLQPQGVHVRSIRGSATSEHEQRPDLSGQRGVTGGRLRDLGNSHHWEKRPNLNGRRTTLSEQMPMLSGATGRGVHGSRLRKLRLVYVALLVQLGTPLRAGRDERAEEEFELRRVAA